MDWLALDMWEDWVLEWGQEVVGIAVQEVVTVECQEEVMWRERGEEVSSQSWMSLLLAFQ